MQLLLHDKIDSSITCLGYKQAEDILKWRKPAASALIFLLGSFCCLAGEFTLRGNHTVTPLKGAHHLNPYAAYTAERHFIMHIRQNPQYVSA